MRFIIYHQGVNHVQIMAHRCCYCQKPFTHAGSRRHHEKYTCWKRLKNGHFPSSPAVTRVDAQKITFPIEINPGIPSGIERGKALQLQEAQLQTNRTHGLKRSGSETPLSAQEEKHSCQRKQHKRKCQRSYFLKKTTLGYLEE